MLKKILTIEEITGPVVEVSINESSFFIPSSWYIMVVDDDGLYVDTVNIMDSIRDGFQAFCVGSTGSKYTKFKISTVDYKQSHTLTYISIPKYNMMFHPIGNNASNPSHIFNCLIGPQDLHKYIIDLSPQDILV